MQSLAVGLLWTLAQEAKHSYLFREQEKNGVAETWLSSSPFQLLLSNGSHTANNFLLWFENASFNVISL